ncbi:MAG: LuxR C-terminal-related transcriptional regulator [Acidimicrobiia bacterium]
MNATETATDREQRSGHRARPVVICDVEQMFSEALAHLLHTEGFSPVEVVSRFDAMVDKVDALPGQPRPLCIMEIDGLEPRAGSPAQLGAMRQLADRTLLVVITRDRDPRDRARALATGIRAFLTKDQPAETVLAALDRVCDPTSPRSGIDPLLGFIAGRSPDPVSSFLTLREQEVLQALVDGESTSGIAQRLGVRPSTLRGYIQRVLMKLGVHSRAAAAAVAVQRGLARPGGGTPVSPEARAGDRLAERR